MKIAFTTSGISVFDELDPRFGRASSFIIYDLDDDSYQVIDNQQNMDAQQGAGVQAAETVAHSGVKAVISGHFGPKAYRVLSSAGIKVYTSKAKTVGDALVEFKEGKLSLSDTPNVEGHWE